MPLFVRLPIVSIFSRCLVNLVNLQVSTLDRQVRDVTASTATLDLNGRALAFATQTDVLSDTRINMANGLRSLISRTPSLN